MSAEALVPALDRTTTGSQVERVLREMILDGTLEPGTHLRETQVAARSACRATRCARRCAASPSTGSSRTTRTEASS